MTLQIVPFLLFFGECLGRLFLLAAAVVLGIGLLHLCPHRYHNTIVYNHLHCMMFLVFLKLLKLIRCRLLKCSAITN